VVGGIAAALGEPNGDGWLVALCMGRIDCHMLCIVGVAVALGNGDAFILGVSDAVVEEQIITFV
jgi:hypothetical protein